MSMLASPEFWVGVAFIGFIALLLYYKVPSLIGAALDKRAETIRSELEEARRLKDEARTLLEDYKKRRAEADKEAEAIIAQARSEASALAKETRAQLDELVQRRTRLTEEKIARAEAQALADVRSAAIEAAIGASRRIIADGLEPARASSLVDESIRELRGKLS